MAEPYILFKIGSADEFDPTKQINGLRFLGISDEGSSPQWTNTYEDDAGRDGSPFLNQKYATRQLKARFWLHFTTYEDFVLAKHDIYAMFAERQAVRVRTDVSPDKVFFGYVTPFDIAPISAGGNDSNFEITFDVPNGYYYSLYRSDSSDFKAQFGMNEVQGEKPQYHFTGGSKLRVYNAGDITIDPYLYRHDVKIITTYSGGSLKLTNTTTETEWEYKKPSDGKTVILDGINTYKDGNLANLDSNAGYLTYKKGWNEITVSGAGSFDIRFSMPFIYLS